MDPEKTAAFQLGEGSTACLMLHGFTGSPWDLRPLGEVLARNGYRVSAIQLPGHCSTPQAMVGVGGADWKLAAERALLGLQGSPRIFVVGLSMGALLALIAAAKRPERVAGLALIAPAVRLRGLGSRLAKWGSSLGLLRLRSWVSKASTDIEDPVQRDAAPLLAAFPSARLLDLWMLQDEALQAAHAIRAPVLIAMADQDHVVSIHGGTALARALTQCPRMHWVRIERGFHVIPRDFGSPILAKQVLSFFGGEGAEHAKPQVPAGD
jgi:carboxylesterase